jgi:hypothetical protein
VASVLQAWKFTETVPQSRRDALVAPGSFEALTDLVTLDATAIRARSKPGGDAGLTDCIQPVFTVELPQSGDALFNGPFGYRAQYWISPTHGLASNCKLLASLAHKLLGAVDLKSDPGLRKIDICASLAGASAKIWIAEEDVLLDGTWDLDIERWVEEARNGVQLARWGISAPIVTKFEVKGALLDPYGNEVVPARKIRRHLDIHHYGFS